MKFVQLTSFDVGICIEICLTSQGMYGLTCYITTVREEQSASISTTAVIYYTIITVLIDSFQYTELWFHWL